MKDLYFLHGMESSPKGTKAQLLKKQYPDIVIPELPPDLTLRDRILDDLIKRQSLIVGSSLGGLSAILFSMRKPELVQEMILLAPAVGFYEKDIFSAQDQKRIAETIIPPGIKCTIFAALNDTVIPLKDIKSLVARSTDKNNISYKEVDDDHSLNRFPDLLLESVKKMVEQYS